MNFTISKRELKNVSLDAKQKEYQVNADKLCNTAADAQITLAAAALIVKNPLWKWLFGLASVMIAALQKKLNCNTNHL